MTAAALDPVATLLAIAALLAAPGPTNALLAAAGATAGLGRAVRLALAAAAGYAVSIAALSLAAGPLVEAWPILAMALKLAAALWLTACALRLWRQADRAAAAPVTAVSPARVMLTTMINPKALIFALVILPRGDAAVLLPWLAALLPLVVATGLAWAGFGAALARSAPRLLTPRRVWRTAALALALFATVIAGTALAG